ncbi:MAG: diacylglycerol kinase [Patescibacteria group bacterium]|nr:MAG: diacylglycerol kinase [Patescibacteria group bacterium]
MISLKKSAKSFTNAWFGLVWALKTQNNFRLHFLLALTAVALGFILNISVFEFLIIATFITLGLVIEMINTAIEKTNDAITTDWRQEIKLAKDVSAGAMLVFSICSLISAGIIFLPKIYNLIISWL